MYKQNEKKGAAICWRHFDHKAYSTFRSLKREIKIGVLAFATLTFANVETVTAQTESHAQNQKEVEMEEVEVTGSRIPTTLNQAARIVTVLDRKAIEAAPVQSVNDLLKYAIGVDVRQRGDLGVQTDISIRGGTFDQITLLLNGANICDPQTGHNAADFPVDLKDIERIEILEGPAGRVYGTSSLLGAINIVTKSDAKSHVDVHAEGGSYGLFQSGARINISKGNFSNQISGNVLRSDGGTENSDSKMQKAYYQGEYTHQDVNVSWQAGYSNKDYGANTFYSGLYPNQFEHTRKYFASAQAETKGFLHLKPMVYWTQAYDRFELIRGDESKVPFNYHKTTTYGLNLNSYFTTILGKTAVGAEMRNEDVISTKLGETLNEPKPISGSDRSYDKGLNRTNISFHLEHNILLDRFTLSAGCMATMNTNLDDHSFRLYPGADASYQLSDAWKIYASYNTSLRMPTFTELYYTTNETHQGNKHLKPEEMQAFELGSKYLTPGVQFTVSAYFHKGKNMIDWVRAADETIWKSINYTRINTWGIEASSLFNINELLGQSFPIKTLYLGYSYIYQDKDENTDYISQYALNNLKHKFVARLEHKIWNKLSASWAFRWQKREGNYTDYSQSTKGEITDFKPYGILDLKISWSTPKYTLYAEGNNLFDKKYYDLGNVRQPGIWIRGGASYRFDL